MGVEDIKHVVILMQENRSFDEYFGTYPLATGFSDPVQFFANKWAGGVMPFRLSTFTAQGEACTGAGHDWGSMHADYDNGAMDGWQEVNPTVPQVLGYYGADDIPFHWALARNFALCDHYFCSVLGPTTSNRVYLMSGELQDPNPAHPGTWAGPVLDNPTAVANSNLCGSNPPVPIANYQAPLSWKSYPDLLHDAGFHSWKVYDETCAPPAWLINPPRAANGWGDLNMLRQFLSWGNIAQSPHVQTTGGRFEADAMAGRLATISWLIPPFGVTEWHENHPADGACYIAQKIYAILNGPLWNSTAFILTYDENDGHFDHVIPPVAPPNVGPPEQPVNGEPIGAGFRVPAIIVSPWTFGAGVQSDLFDHTSILQLLEIVTGVQCLPNLPLGGYRRTTFGDLTSVFNFANAASAAEVQLALPLFDQVLQWNLNAKARLAGQAEQPSPPQPQPTWPPDTQSCAANSPSFAKGDVYNEMEKEQAELAPQPGGPGTATMQDALTVVVRGFEPDEFTEIHAGYPPGVPANPNPPLVNGNPLQQASRVPLVTVVDGASPGELTFTCTEMSADPAVLGAQTPPGVSQTISFTFSATFKSPIVSFAFRSGTVRLLDIQVSFTVDTTVTTFSRIALTGGTIQIQPLDACANLAEQIAEAEAALLAAQRAAPSYADGNASVIHAMEMALAALQNQYAKYCGSGGSSGPSGPGGHVHLGGG